MANSLFLVLIANGLLVASVGAHSGAHYLSSVSSRAQDQSKVLVCDDESEFQCIKDNRCISLGQVCDFVRDCSDGQDETKCGNCDFSQAPADCGLRLQPAGAFTWFRHEQVNGLDDGEPVERRFYMHTGLDVTKRQYLDLLHNNWHLVYRPKIVFPQLRPTDNERCQFSLQMRITQHEDPELNSVALTQKHKLAPSWPQVFMMLLQPRRSESQEERDGFVEGHKAFDFQVQDRSKPEGLGHWQSYTVPLGVRQTVWSLELMVEARISSYLVQVADFKFVDCEPTGAKRKEELEATERPLYSTAPCLPGQFKCQLGGQCIDESLVCDFGYDCGQDDLSDEDQCDNYLGRCDFESANLCHWFSRPHRDSWLWVAANDGTTSGQHLGRPKVDHTYRGQLMESSDESGHYMLLNLNKLDQTSMMFLAGPRVSLRESARACHFRFWYHSARSLDDQLAASPAFLAVGPHRVPASRLFSRPDGPASGSRRKLNGGLRTHNADWQRLEVELLNRAELGDELGAPQAIRVLEVSFGHLLKDLELFRARSGHLALDDFSFSSGCQLQFARPADERGAGSECPSGLFQCLVPAPVTGARCLPQASYCDFKNDCGLAHPLDSLSSDEQFCPHDCHFRFAENCHLEVMDGVARRRAGELRDDERLNQALGWSMSSSTSEVPGSEPGYLTIYSRAHSYLSEWLRQVSQAAALERRVNSLEFRMPVFSQSHANCSIQLDYQWMAGSEELQLNWYLEVQDLAYRHPVKRMLPASGASSARQTTAFGLGHQPGRFRLIGEVLFVHGLADMKAHTGSISIYSYQFLGCSFPRGLASASHEPQVAPGEEVAADSEYGDPTDYLDYSEPRLSPNRDSSEARTCLEHEFQCQEPLACIPRHQVCDMQLDCQLGDDERDCSRQLRWNFDGDSGSASRSWFLVVDGHQRLEPQMGGGGGNDSRRQDEDLGPPYDHTRSNKLGQYLSLGPNQRLSSPRLSWHGGETGCQLVFYLYDYEGRQSADELHQRGELRVSRLVGPGGHQERVYATVLGGRDDQWRRHSARIEANEGAEPFELLFEWLSKGSGKLLALDDISLGASCQLDGGGGDQVALPLSNGSDERRPDNDGGGGGGRRLAWLLVALALATAGALLAWQSRRATAPRPASTYRQWQQLTQLDVAKLLRH